MVGVRIMATACALLAGCKLNFDPFGDDAPEIDAAIDAVPDARLPVSSCELLPARCGPSANESCCATAPAAANTTFYRSYDLSGDAQFSAMTWPATVDSFRLDRFEVTVGRFREFVRAQQGTEQNPPATGAGAHPSIPSSGWDPAWNTYLANDLSSALGCDATFATWTPAPGANEDKPITCATWYEAAAFCAWDGGWLPTEAEWNYAASSGTQYRAFPWSSPAGDTTIDCTYANYGGPTAIDGMPATWCQPSMTDVGTFSPKGDTAYGHADMAGNVWEWVLDTWNTTYPVPCVSCADLSGIDDRVFRGGSFGGDTATLYERTGNRDHGTASSRFFSVGFRCARP